jgi:hypothetical protein
MPVAFTGDATTLDGLRGRATALDAVALVVGDVQRDKLLTMIKFGRGSPAGAIGSVLSRLLALNALDDLMSTPILRKRSLKEAG